ncbi:MULTISPECIES: helix-turn-helix domain-containing protein [Pseudomonas]|uniref:helix-turn-helix domain-containing protein n=1 Tax=Pseudomonas TaxID=286 RepID=UPI00058D4D3C|nr:helix-turn-helix transcriptional regulator [Pseudomonas massiliensis]
MEMAERAKLLTEVQEKLATGELTIGKAIQKLRKEFTGLDQERFASLCKLSTRALRKLEHDQANPTLQTLNSVFKPFGMQVGIVPAPKKHRGARV